MCSEMFIARMSVISRVWEIKDVFIQAKAVGCRVMSFRWTFVSQFGLRSSLSLVSFFSNQEKIVTVVYVMFFSTV